MDKMNLCFVIVVALSFTWNCLGYELEEEAEVLTNQNLVPKETKQFELVRTLKVSWENAFAECKTRNMTLASISNEEEQNTLKSVITQKDLTWTKNEVLWFNIGPYSAFWVSGYAGKGETFYWNSTGSPMKFTNWSENEPNVFRDYRCVLVNNRSDGKWMTYSCQEKEYFICEHH